jgi:hypothetical protein
MSTSSRPLSDRAAFERFKEAHPELGSALKIAAIDEKEFVQTFADGQELDDRQAYRIHQTARRIQEQTALVWANLKDVASPFLRQTLFNNIPQEFLDRQAQIPGYDRLFGSLDYIECDESRSVLSPAAYFVDLMRFVEETISRHADNDFPEVCQLDQRRPDLFRLRLDENNTFDLIPYIDLVNEVLESLVTSAANPSAEAAIESAVFPQSLPLNLPLAEIRQYLQQLEWALPQVYETFATPADNKQTAIQRERLSLSPQEFELLGNSLVDEPAKLSAVYGFENLETALRSLSTVKVFLERTGLNRQELNDLVYQDLDRFEVNAGLSRLFFINAVDDGLGQLTIDQGPGDPENPTRPPAETLLNLSAAKLDRIYRFLKLARRLEWSFADLDWALRSLDTPYTPERVLQFDGLNDFVQIPAQPGTSGDSSTPAGLATLSSTFTVEAWVNPARHQDNPILSRGIEGDTNIHFLLCLTAAGRVAFYGSAATNEVLTSLQTLPTEEFTHVAITVQTASTQSTVQIFLNGELDRVGTLPAVQPPAGDLDINIGRNLSDTTFAGLIKDVRVWSEARSAGAISGGRYRRLTGFETNLAAYWPLTETHGIELLDRSPYRQHGIPGGEAFVTQPRWVSADLVLEPLPERIGETGYQFNGTDQFLAARDVSGLEANQFTLEAWIRVDAAGHNTIISKGNGGNRQTQFLLWVDEQNRLVFRSSEFSPEEFRSQSEVALGNFTHVAVTVAAADIRLYLNGRLEATLPRPAGADIIDPRGDDLAIGNDFSENYFNGIIQEVRVWNYARSAIELNSFLQRAVPPLAPGLIGYWPLHAINGEQAQDLSVNQNALYLGGVPEDFRPAVVTVDPLLPELPVAAPGAALQFDGDQDLLVLRHDSNFGLGRYPRFTLEFWFKPNQQTFNPEVPQLLFSQGDGEAGLAVYLERGRLVAIAWCANYELTEVQETVLSSPEEAVTPDQWHHVAIIHDETQNLDYIEFRGFLNGVALTETSSTHENSTLAAGQRGYRLSPVGLVYLGGIDTTGMTRFQGTYLEANDARLRGFAGQITDLRLWNVARTAAVIDTERHLAPSLDAPGLMVYLPLDEGQDITVTDGVNGYTGQLRGNESVFMATPSADPELQNRYSHYAPEGETVLDWSNYVYSGLLYVPAIPAGVTTGGMGVTFLSRHPALVDQFYRLQVTWPEGTPTFSLAAHPQNVQPLTVEQPDFHVPTPGLWYAFRIQVIDLEDENRTTIAVTLWPDGTPQPQQPQITAYDDSDLRITAGTVGLWVAGDQPPILAARFNNLRVASLAADGREGNTLLIANFKNYLPGENPTGWVDTVDRLTPLDASDLFSPLALNGRTVLRTESDLEGIHSHYFPAAGNVLDWNNYSYQGKLRFTDGNSGIGLTFFSRTPEGIDQFYVLRRTADQPSFYLAAHPLGVQPLTAEADSRLDSGVFPEPDQDYFVQVEVQTTDDRTQIRAKVWAAGTAEPEDFQIRAFDDSAIRMTAGTVGIWTAGPGTKTFDDLKVLQETLLSEDFSAQGPNQILDGNWFSTGSNNSDGEVPALFQTADQDGNIVFGTQSPLANIHSHYRAAAALEWKNYSYSGRLFIGDENGRFDGIGVTFLSRYTDPIALDLNQNQHNQYYRLRRFRGIETFHIAPHPHDVRTVDIAGRDTGVNPKANTWYRFLIEVNDTGSRTQIRAKVWEDGTPEPAEFQAITFDDSNVRNPNQRRLTAGTVGLWAARDGQKYFDDLQVRQGLYLSADLSLEDWQTTGNRNVFAPDDTLFAAEYIPDQPLWQQVEDLPLLRQPLNRSALDFDGDLNYLALPSLNGELAGSFTLAAWIRPNAIDRVNPVMGWAENVWFGLNEAGQVTLTAGENSLSGETVLPADTFTHVAVAMDGDTVTLYVNGVVDGEGAVPAVALTAETVVEVGRSGEQYLAGQIRDLRLWNAVLSDFPMHQRYQGPDTASAALLAYWTFADFDNAFTLDDSAHANHLRLGGLEPARKPTLFKGDRVADSDFWQQGRTMLTFHSAEDSLVVPPGEAAEVLKRHTLEVWVKVNDPQITQRRQVIYHSGDAQQGLVIYVHDGLLHFGGYDQAQGWPGTWLQTDRILANCWHHVALVLDGRAEVRPQAFRAYLDGKLVDAGDGVQISTLPTVLGAAAGEIRFHDGVAPAADTHLEGAVLELRLWDTARTSEEIAAHRYAVLVGNEPNLALWWRFKDISAESPEIIDGSGHSRTAILDNLARLQPLQPLAIGNLPAPVLSQATLLELATFRQLMERHRQSVERLTALWYDLRHTGRADNPVFFDRVFNPTGLMENPWGYHDPARRWDVTGQELPSRDRAIRSRLMGALQLSSDDLDRVVALVSGTETPVEVDIAYLQRLYRLSQLPRVLRLTVREYLIVLEMLGLSGIESLADLALVSDRILELRRIGVSVDELNFLANDVSSPRIRPPYTDATLRVFADDIVNQATEYLIAPLTFVSDDISELQSATIVDFFKPAEAERVIGALTSRYFVDDLGAVTDRYQSPEDLQELAIAQNWATPFNQLGRNIFAALQAAGFVNEYGIVLRAADLDQFPEAFGSNPPSPTVLANVQAVLENQNNRQNAIIETLVRYRDEHRNAILAGLSELLGVEPEPLQAVLNYFQSIGEPLSDPSHLLERLMTLEENLPIPADLLDYCFRLFKILFLAARFELTTAEIQVLLSHPECFSVSDVFRPGLEDLVNLFTFTELKAAFGDEDQLVQLLTQESGTMALGLAILDISGWDEPQLVAAINHFGPELAYNRVENLIRLQRAFALAEVLRVDISFMLQLAATDDLSLAFYRQQADALLPALRGLYDDEQWPQVFRPLHDPLTLQKRDALLALAMEDIPDNFEGRRSPDLLSEYLLLDVQVSSEVETSRIVQGTAALQQYVQRCLMNLEKGVNPATIPTDQWAWMQNYRVWEANRKVFLYPESFIEPELRDTKTPLFEELEQELMQGEINQDAVTRAYTRYLNRFTEVANLKIVGSYRHKPLEGETGDEILYLVGRTQSQPARFFYRELVNNTQWRPWKEIDLVLDSEHVSPVYAFGRLFLFWAELMELSKPMDVGPVRVTTTDPDNPDNRAAQTLEGEGITQRDIDDYRAGRRSIDPQGFLFNDTVGERVQRNVDVFRPTVKYAYLDADQTWTAPQTYLELDDSLRAEEAILPNWQRVLPQRVLSLGSEDEIPQETNAQVLELDSNTAIINAIPRFDMRRLTWSFWVKLENQQLSGFIGSRPGSPVTTILEYGGVLNATARANIIAIPGIRDAVILSINTAALIADQIPDFRSADEAVRQNAANNLQLGITRLEEALAGLNTPTNLDIVRPVNRLTNAINNLITAVRGYVTNPTDSTAAAGLLATGFVTTAADNTPQWQAGTWKLQFVYTGTPGRVLGEVDLPFGVWQHVALTFDYQQTGEYEVNLYVGSNQTGASSVFRGPGRLGNLLPTGQLLSIGNSLPQSYRNANDAILSPNRSASPQNTFFTTQLSEFRLWEQVRDLEAINASRNVRLSGREPGVFYLPLNRPPQVNVYLLDLARRIANRNTLVPSTLTFQLNAIIPIDLERERILVFYGNQVRSIRNNLEEQSFALQLENRFANFTNYDVNLSLFSPAAANGNLPNSRGLIFHLDLTNGLSLNDYVDGEHSTLNRFTPASLRALQEQSNNLAFFNIFNRLQDILEEIQDNQEFIGRNFLLRNLPRFEASVIDVGNQPGWYILDTGDEQYLVQVDIDNLQTAGERIRFEYAQSSSGDVRQQILVYFDRDAALEAVDPNNDTNLPRFRFTRLSTFAVHDLSVKLFTQGIDGLLSLEAQQTEELDFNSYQPFTYDPDSGLGLVLTEGITETLDFEGSYGLYYREIFFHIPFFIANQLNTNQSFADAQRWYHYLFNPTTSESNNGAGFNPDRFWQYLPLRNLSLETLRQMLENEEALAEYREDPFDPHAIARLRINAYQKAIVMKYIDNLLDWADNLFLQDNRESINQAFLLYVLAFNLLGPRPEARASRRFEEIGDYQGIREAFGETPEFLTELDLNGNVAARTSTITLNQSGNIITTFCIPENSDFIGFWDRVEDRLFKIRHSLTIEGIFRQLALFQPPLDVRALVQAAAAGGRDIGSLLADLNVPVPHYRYSFMLERAKEMIGNVKDFGAAPAGCAGKTGCRTTRHAANHPRTQHPQPHHRRPGSGCGYGQGNYRSPRHQPPAHR